MSTIIRPTLFAILCLCGQFSSGAAQSETKTQPEAKAPAGKPPRKGPLAGLPSAPGGHLEKILALGEDQWVRLEAPRPDPPWGTARGRSWGGRAFILAPDLRGAFFYGEGPHAMVKPDGHIMDDLWFYDINGNRWIAVYPGTDIKSFNQRVKAKELLVDSNGQVVDKEGQPIPIHTLIHAWDLLSYDTNLHQFAFVAGDGMGRYYLGGMPEIDEGVKQLEAQKAGKKVPPLGPWIYDVGKGKFERTPTSGASSNQGDLPLFQYVPSRRQYFFGGGQAVNWYDPTTRTWSIEKDKGPRPGGYDHGGCYDEKRDRIYMGPGTGDAGGGIYIYDIRTATWTKASPKGPGPQSFATNYASVFYDGANDVVTVFHYANKKVYSYDPNTDTWTERPFPPNVLTCIGYPSFNAFYDRKLNAYFCYAASDGADNGVMWAYRYKIGKREKKAKDDGR